MKKLILTLFLASASAYSADTTSFSFGSDGVLLKSSNNSTLLSGGSTSDGDGARVQIGYFTTATSGSLFSGVFTPIAGEGTSLYSTLSIGDFNVEGGTNGEIYTGLLDFVTGGSYPASNAILAVRFYNNTSIATSTYQATASAASWTWVAPATPSSSITLSLQDSGVSWQGGYTAYTGNLVSAIPEPSTYAALAGLAILGVAASRRRRSV